MPPEIKPQIIIRQDAQGKKMLEVPGHRSIKKNPRYTSADFAELYDLARYEATRIISGIKVENPDNPDIIGERIPGKPRQLDYNEAGFLFFVHYYDQLLENRGGRRTKTTQNR